MTLEHKEYETKGSFHFIENGKIVAEMTYSKAGVEKIIIDHTEVNDAYRGQNLGEQLVFASVDYARQKNLKILPLCPFARSVFLKNKSIQDVT